MSADDLIDIYKTLRDDPIPTRDVGDGRRLYLYPMMFTHRLAIGNINEEGLWYTDSWCFHERKDALHQLETWNPLDPATPEPSGWHRHPASGRRRPEGDPAREYIAP